MLFWNRWNQESAVNPLKCQTRRTFNRSRANLNGPIRNTFIVFCWNQSETILLHGFPTALDLSSTCAKELSVEIDLKPLKARQPNLRACHCVVFQNRYWILSSHLGFVYSVGESEVAGNFDPYGKISESGWRKYVSICTVKLYIYYQLRLDAFFSLAKQVFRRREKPV